MYEYIYIWNGKSDSQLARTYQLVIVTIAVNREHGGKRGVARKDDAGNRKPDKDCLARTLFPSVTHTGTVFFFSFFHADNFLTK